MPTPIAEIPELNAQAEDAHPVEPDPKGAEELPEPERPVEVITAPARSIKLRQHLNNSWRVRLPAGVTLEMAQDADYLAKCIILGSKHYSMFDDILCVADSARWAVETIVTGVGIGWVHLSVLRVIDIPDRSPEAEGRVPAGHSIRYDQHENYWYGQRDSDHARLADRCQSREEATRELMSHASLHDSGTFGVSKHG